MKKFSRKLIFSILSFILAVIVIGTSIFTIAENTQKNIALDADVYVDTADWSTKRSDYVFYINNLGPKFLNDGSTSDSNKFFSSPELSSPNATEVITMVFDGTYDVNKISLVPRGTTRNGIPEDFTLSVYNGSEWAVIDSKKGNTDIDITYTLNDVATTCTAVRLEVTKLSRVLNTSNYSLQLAEFEVWGKKSDSKLAKPYILEDAENVAKGANVDFDVPGWAQNDFSKTKITDGVFNEHKNFATTDSLKENQKQEVYVTLDKVCKIDEISLYPAVQVVGGSLKYVGGFPVNYTLSVWNGSRWCEVGSEKDFSMGSYEAAANTVSAKKYKFDVIETNAIRLTVDKHSAVNTADTQFALRLAEIMVNGVKTNKTDFNNPVYIKDYKDIELQKSDASDENNLIYTFDRTYAVKEVVLGGKEIASFPKQFSVSLWNGEEWQTIDKWDSFDIKNSKLHIVVDGINSRGIKIKSNDELTDLDLSKAELVVCANTVNTIIKPAPPIVNATLGATAETDTPSWAQQGFPASNLVDGKADTAMTTAYSTSADTQKTVTITLDGTYDISSVNLYPRVKSGTVYGFPVDFTISVWDGTDWKTVKTVADETDPDSNSLKSYEFTAVSCSAIKIDVTKLGGSDSTNEPYVLQLAELEALGTVSSTTIAPPGDSGDQGGSGDGDTDGGNTPSVPQGDNAALKGTVSMQVPSWATNFKAENLVDGSTATAVTTEFYTEQNKKESASIVFKNGAYTIKTIVLYPRVVSGTVYGFPTDFTISAWNGTEWVEVHARTGLVKNTAQPVTIELDTPIICNAIKIEATKLGKSDNSGKPYTMQFAEIEAYGDKSNASIAAPSVDKNESNNQSTVDKPAGENAALGGTATMEVPKWAENFQAKNLVDGSIAANSFATSEYYSEQKTKESASVVFKNGAYTIKSIMLYPRVKGSEIYGFPTDFTISAWDGSKWVEVNARTGLAKNTAEPVRIDLTTPILCNAIKIDATKLGKADNQGKYTLQLAEIEAYGEKSSKTLATPSVSTGTTGGAGAVTLNNDGNLALNKPIKASSDLAQYNAPVTKANDGQLSSYWASNDTKFVKGEPQWVEINLLNNYAVNKVVLGARQNALGFPYDIDIEVFYNGEWKKAYSVTGFEANEKAGYTAYEFTFSAVIGNKVRVSSANFRKVGSSNSMVLSEVAVYGDKVSGNYVLPNENMITSGVGITATSSMEDYDYYLAHLIDNSLTTSWSTVPSVEMTPQSVEVDMKCEVQLSEIQLKPGYMGYGFPIDFTISVFEDGKWVDVYTAKDYKQPQDEAIQRFQFDKRNATKFRITATKLPMQAGLYVWKMNEIIAYPLHTGDDFDPNSTEITTSLKKNEAAKVVAVKGSEKIKVEISWWKIVAGSVLTVIAVLGCVAMLIILKKRKFKF